LAAWAEEICQGMVGVCELLDGDRVDRPYSRSLALQREVIADPERAPSARMLREMREQREPFFGLARRMSHQHQRYFDALEPNAEREAHFTRIAEASLSEQAAIEAAEQPEFGEFLRAYFAQR
jgi:glutamate--cysteine ligase